MTSTTARLTQLEGLVAKLVVAKGPRVSDMLKQARVRSQQGEVAPALYDVAELERDAAGPGLRGAMARSRLRMIRGFDRDALQAAIVETQDAVVEDGTGKNPAAPCCTAPVPAATGPSVSDRDLLLQRIDATLARAGGHV